MRPKTQHLIEKGALILFTLVHLIVGCPWIILIIFDILGRNVYSFPITLAATLLSFAPYYWILTRWWRPREMQLKDRIKLEKNEG
jgi:hypothetical protein